VAPQMTVMGVLDTVADARGTVDAVYQHFGLTLPTTAAQAMTHFVEARPDGGYGPHAYRFEDHGLDPDAEREKFRPYLLHFDIKPESGPVRQGTSAGSGRYSTRRMATERIGPNVRAANWRGQSTAPARARGRAARAKENAGMVEARNIYRTAKSGD